MGSTQQPLSSLPTYCHFNCEMSRGHARSNGRLGRATREVDPEVDAQ